MDKFEDVEKTGVARAEVNETSEGDSSILYGKTFWGKLRTWGVELRGIVPVPVEERIDGHFINILSLFSTMSLNILALVCSDQEFAWTLTNALPGSSLE